MHVCCHRSNSGLAYCYTTFLMAKIVCPTCSFVSTDAITRLDAGGAWRCSWCVVARTHLPQEWGHGQGDQTLSAMPPAGPVDVGCFSGTFPTNTGAGRVRGREGRKEARREREKYKWCRFCALNMRSTPTHCGIACTVV